MHQETSSPSVSLMVELGLDGAKTQKSEYDVSPCPGEGSNGTHRRYYSLSQSGTETAGLRWKNCTDCSQSEAHERMDPRRGKFGTAEWDQGDDKL